MRYASPFLCTLEPWLLLKPFLGDFHNHHLQKQTFTLSHNFDILIRMKNKQML